ncbi:uncharacterized protein LACBIDRAFT_240706 [Laccaria bicolor S238N-H82]|uniref:Predicted protein n=1 Tax=Laccaria bicolor (strain S238N-H82 / ATCC MYA-4686) TaxID=486041 RepID=B0DYN7_LACBS|nr:uncharacterized protein LACBIDRAFT_240706 [Laccaria bicolor S238N-H82]EDR00323.1 predicted protein [Laccaria bicolor S238N-H82]|eukprot:XP_001889075.1 predicted protein [Laccaria bicolor S238N-H82]
MSPLEISKKLVIVGDGTVGKTCLLIRSVKGFFPEIYVPTVFENHVQEFDFDQVKIQLALWDTASQCDYDGLRPLSYIDADVILIAFAVDSQDSFDNITEKWFEEVTRWCPGVPIFLVACKMELRHDPQTINTLSAYGMEPVTQEQGMSLAQKIGASYYGETSAKNGHGVEDLFDRAAHAAMQHKRRERKNYSCIVV